MTTETTEKSSELDQYIQYTVPFSSDGGTPTVEDIQLLREFMPRGHDAIAEGADSPRPIEPLSWIWRMLIDFIFAGHGWPDLRHYARFELLCFYDSDMQLRAAYLVLNDEKAHNSVHYGLISDPEIPEKLRTELHQWAFAQRRQNLNQPPVPAS